MIEVSDLTKRYGGHTAIDRVSFKVEPGEILGFLGPNGAGKSTTMRILTGALGATEGSACIAGFDIADKPREAKRRVGYLPEVPPVYPEMLVYEYLDYAARLHGVPRGDRKRAVSQALERCSLDKVADRLIRNLSKGYQQRVGLAQALVHEPPVLVLDEPTVGLDPNQIMEVRRLIKSLAGKHTIILSTHILPEVQMTCQKVVIINRGRIVVQPTPLEQLSAQTGRSDTLLLDVRTAAEDADAALKRVEGIQSVSREAPVEGDGHRFRITMAREVDAREEIAALAVRSGWGLRELTRVRASLEDVFRDLTTVEVGVMPESGASTGVGEQGGAQS